MQFLSIYHSLNQTYNVEQNALEQAVKKAFAETAKDKAQAKKIEVELVERTNTVNVKLTLALAKSSNYQDVISALYAKIEQYIENIIGTKAENISIIVSERE